MTPPPAAQWTPRRPCGRVDATVHVPGSKSITARALLLCALGKPGSTARNVLHARDSLLMVQALASLGAQLQWQAAPADTAAGTEQALVGCASRVMCRGPLRPSATAPANATVDAGLAGTVLRFALPVAATLNRSARFTGDAALARRPIAPLTRALRSMGYLIDGDALPLAVSPGAENGTVATDVTIDARESSQFISGLLLAGWLLPRGLRVHALHADVPSRPHIDMTCSVLRQAGIDAAAVDEQTWRVQPAAPPHIDLIVEPDISSAAPFIAAALVTGGCVRIAQWPTTTDQAGPELIDVLTRMGARVSHDEHGLLCSGTGLVQGLDIDARRFGELVPVLAATATYAESPTTIRGVAHLAGHETDRLAALARELSGCGADVQATRDGLHIVPGPRRAHTFATYSDHRLVHAGAIMALGNHDVRVVDPGTAAKTLPGFDRMWDALLSGAQLVSAPRVSHTAALQA